MNRIISLVTVLAAAALVGLSTGAVAQETTATNATENTSSTVIRVDSGLSVTEFEWSDGRFEIVFEATRYRRVTVSEAIGRAGGSDGDEAGRFNARRFEIGSGETKTVSIPAQKVNGKAIVTIVTRQSLADGGGVFLESGSAGGSFLSNPATVRDVLVAGGIGALGTGYFSLRRARREQEGDDPEVDRLA